MQSSPEPGTEVLVCVGGLSSAGRLSSAEVYDAEEDSWCNAAPMSIKRNLTAAATWNGKVVVAGGEGLNQVVLDSAEQYDPATDRWTEFTSLRTARNGHALVNADGTLFAIGGTNGNAALGSVERYNAESGQWQPAPALNIPRFGLAAAAIRVCYLTLS